MPLGVTLTQLLAELRGAIGDSVKVNIGVDNNDADKADLARMQRVLYAGHKWPHLSVTRSVALNIGARYYNRPADVDLDQLAQVQVFGWGGCPLPVDRGIGFQHFAEWDSDADERDAPVRAWDVRWTGSASQIEVWPIPNVAGMTLRFFGQRALGPLTDGDHTCSIDSDLIVLFLAAERLARQGAEDAENKLALANKHLRTLINNAAGSERMSGNGVQLRSGRLSGVQVIPSIRG